MKFSTLTVAAALALAGSVAQAASYNLGDITATGASQNSASFANGANFTDSWNFSLTGANDVAALISANFARPEFAFSNFQAFVSGGNLPGQVALNLTSGNSFQILEGSGPTIAGNYTITVSGISNRNNSFYTFNVDVSPVPEPSSYALLMVGLGVVGFMARRSRKV
ncbi:PEP-CTERM sorting domain-containing protein [Paucibacter sp. DJ1R-11]|uniref:PEP-CTERM sorting domain-containing protein n=1 Tax=Paucibacter sp. DJ1R-11 TaxID=2893556 RepID=UPI0021E46350|nr:PEP-CTERM sorting domain-containing protein [Paucibacter sp. DJ1R-11]MCV2362778.1 PEP-CTERM sorting domain-containing protein [Paucibacter sp. DJ1R-11]